jgi:hypothetical protein
VFFSGNCEPLFLITACGAILQIGSELFSPISQIIGEVCRPQPELRALLAQVHRGTSRALLDTGLAQPLGPTRDPGGRVVATGSSLEGVNFTFVLDALPTVTPGTALRS